MVDASHAMVHRAIRGWVSFASCLLAAGLSAQTPLPLPASHAAMEGTTSTNIPFGRSTPTRVQYVYDGSLFSGVTTVTAVQFRLDGGAVANQKTVDCEMFLSTLPSNLVGMSATFASNRGTDEMNVFSRQLLTLPAQAAGATPNAFLPQIDLTTPFVYDPANGCLVLEIVVHGQPPGAYSLDATFVCDSPLVPIGPMSCTGSNGMPLRVESATTQVIWGRPWIVRALDATPDQVIVLALGTRETGTWSGMNLPQDLGFLGAPGCFLSIDAPALAWGVSLPDGTVQFPFSIPNDPQALGFWLRFQAAAFDAGANSLGLVTSQAQKVQVCGWEPVGRVWSSGTSALFGTREIGLATVVQLVTQ